MNTVITRALVSKAKPAPVVSPLESVQARIQSALDLISMSATVSSTGAHLAMLLVGLETEMLPNALSILRAKSVSKVGVASAYEKLLVPLSVLHAAAVLAKNLVMESTLQQAFEILDRAHSDMDSALVQHWPIPDQPPTQNGPAGDAADFERGTVPTEPGSAAPQVPDRTSTTNEALGIELAAANTTTVMRVAAHDANSDAVWGVFKLNELASEAANAALRQADDTPDIDGLWAASSLYAQAIKLCGLVCANADNELVYAGLMLMEITKGRVDTLAQAEMDKEAQA